MGLLEERLQGKSLADYTNTQLRLALGAVLYTNTADMWKKYLNQLGYTGDVAQMLQKYYVDYSVPDVFRNYINAGMSIPAYIINDAGELAPYVTFTRSSTATRYNSAGLLETVAANAPRYDYDPVTVTRANLIKYSEEFGASDWIKIDASIGSNVSLSPDGTLTADNLVPSTGNLTHYAYQTFVFTNGATYTFSVYAKAGGYNRFMIREGTNSGIYATFDVLTGTVISNNSTTANITPVGNGWYRCDMTITANGFSGNSVMAILNMPNNGSVYANAKFSGNGTDGVLLWGAQFQTGSVATAYIPTTASPAGNATLRGLLIEEQRTNLLTYSEQFDNAVWIKESASIIENSTIAPNGTMTADALVPNNTNSIYKSAYVFISASLVDGTVYTASIYAKPNGYRYIHIGDTANVAFGAMFDLQTGTVASTNGISGSNVSATIFSLPNGWFRISVTFTDVGEPPAITNARLISIRPFPTSTIQAYTGNGIDSIFVWGAQLEAGAFATSYIPTTTAAVTRAADVASVPALSSIGFNPTEGTLFAQASFMAPAPHTSVQGIVSIQNNAFTNIHLINRQTAGSLFGVSVDSGVTQAQPNTGLMPTNTAFKTAYAYKANDFGICTNGGTPVTDNAGTVASAFDAMLVGNAGGILNGHIRRLRYYPVRLSNAQLQRLTA